MKYRTIYHICVAVTLCWYCTPQAHGQGCPDNIYRVKADTPAGDDGCSWGTAFDSLQNALIVAGQGDQVWVAAGTYKPNDQNDSFELESWLDIYGGLAGDETQQTFDPPDVDNRDFEANETILSGNLDGGNCYVVIDATGANDAKLDGFTITGGNGGHGGDDGGAGVYVGWPSTATFRNLLIIGNQVPDYAWGGGMFIDGYCQPVLENCTFRENRGGAGGGLFIRESSERPFVEKCTFIDNVAANGGGVFNQSYGDLVLYDCIFVGNRAHDGGGLTNQFDVELVNCLFNGNTAFNNGGAIDDLGDAVLRNCTLSNNACFCGVGGGIRLTGANTDTLVNSVFWGNSDSEGPGETAQIRVASGSPSVKAKVFWNDGVFVVAL